MSQHCAVNKIRAEDCRNFFCLQRRDVFPKPAWHDPCLQDAPLAEGSGASAAGEVPPLSGGPEPEERGEACPWVEQHTDPVPPCACALWPQWPIWTPAPG